MKRRWIDVLLVLGVVVLVAVALIIGAEKSSEDEEAFGGTDAKVTEMLEDEDYEPWFEPLFSPDSGEVESGLFAFQAALGAGVLGYCLGVMRRRSREDDESATTPTALPDHTTGEPEQAPGR